MNIIRLKSLIKSARSPLAWFNLLSQHGLFNNVSDKLYLKILFRLRMGYNLDLDNPKTFNEKLQWLKLYDRKPEYIKMVDKYEAKKYVASIIGEEHIIPTLGVWDDPDEIDFDSLPNQFVLKCTHNSGYGMRICKDKSTLDVAKVKSELKKGLKQNYFYPGREWPYKDVKPRVIAEKYMEDDTGELTDYKVYCFNGVPSFILVCKNRFTEVGMTEDYFSKEWEHLNVYSEAHGQSEETIEKPTTLAEMLSFSEKLAEDIPFVRTDYYSIGKELYFGELTFYPVSGFKSFEPKSLDNTFGSWIELPHTHTHTRRVSGFRLVLIMPFGYMENTMKLAS